MCLVGVTDAWRRGGATAQVLLRGGCASPADCLLLVSARDPATGAPLRPAAVRSLTLWAQARLPPAVVTVTPLGGGAFSVAADSVAPHTMLHAAEAGHFSENNLLLLPGVPQTTVWVPAPGGSAVPSGVYAVTINGGTPGVVGPGVAVAP